MGDRCSHDWPGSSCPDCRADREAKSEPLRSQDEQDFAAWLRGDKSLKLTPKKLRDFQDQLNIQIHAQIDEAGRIRHMARVIRNAFADGLDEGVSMHIARQVAALSDSSNKGALLTARRTIEKLETRDVHDGYDGRGNYVWKDYVLKSDVMAALDAAS